MVGIAIVDTTRTEGLDHMQAYREMIIAITLCQDKPVLICHRIPNCRTLCG